MKAAVQVSPPGILYSSGETLISCDRTGVLQVGNQFNTYFQLFQTHSPTLKRNDFLAWDWVCLMQHLLFLNALVARKQDVECPKDINI